MVTDAYRAMRNELRTAGIKGNFSSFLILILFFLNRFSNLRGFKSSIFFFLGIFLWGYSDF